MVETVLTHKVLKLLEKYLIRKNDFRLSGSTYDLILLVPSDRFLLDTKHSLIVSAKILDNLSQKDVIIELLNGFKATLSLEEYNAITRVNIVHSEDSLVKNLKSVFAFRTETTEINDLAVGGINIDFAYLIKSLVLDKLVEKKALSLEVINLEGTIDEIKAGVIRIEKNYDIVYYTGKGLREIWKPEMTEEEKNNAAFLKKQTEDYLIKEQFISKTMLDDIIKVT